MATHWRDQGRREATVRSLATHTTSVSSPLTAARLMGDVGPTISRRAGRSTERPPAGPVAIDQRTRTATVRLVPAAFRSLAGATTRNR